MGDNGPRIYGRAGDVEVTVEGNDSETVDDITDTFDEKLDVVVEKRQRMRDSGPNKGCE